MDVGQNGRPRGPQILVYFSINHPIIEVPHFDPYPNDHKDCWVLLVALAGSSIEIFAE